MGNIQMWLNVDMVNQCHNRNQQLIRTTDLSNTGWFTRTTVDEGWFSNWLTDSSVSWNHLIWFWYDWSICYYNWIHRSNCDGWKDSWIQMILWFSLFLLIWMDYCTTTMTLFRIDLVNTDWLETTVTLWEWFWIEIMMIMFRI